MNHSPFFKKIFNADQKNYVHVEYFDGWLINSLQSHEISEMPFLSRHTINNFNNKVCLM